MKNPGIIFLVICMCFEAFAFEDIGTLTDARKSHPEIFIPGSVNTLDFKSQTHYVFSGESEQCFTGEFVESTSELYDEATLSAKNNFFEFMTKGNKNLSVNMSGTTVLYQYNDKKIYTVILAVPKKQVTITKNNPATFRAEQESPSAISLVMPQQSKTTTTIVAPEESVHKTVSQETQSAVTESTAVNIGNPTQRRIEKYISRIKKDPDDIISHIRLGELYEQEENFNEAISSLRKAVKLIGESQYFDNAETIRILLKTAELCEQGKRYNLALKYYSLLLKYNCPKQYYDIATSKISKIRLIVIK